MTPKSDFLRGLEAGRLEGAMASVITLAAQLDNAVVWIERAEKAGAIDTWHREQLSFPTSAIEASLDALKEALYHPPKLKDVA